MQSACIIFRPRTGSQKISNRILISEESQGLAANAMNCVTEDQKDENGLNWATLACRGRQGRSEK
jgi:hypothetical protein